MYIGRERMVVRRAELAGLSRVKKVAPATWPATYAGIIPDEVQRRLLDTWYLRERSSRDLVAPGGKKARAATLVLRNSLARPLRRRRLQAG